MSRTVVAALALGLLLLPAVARAQDGDSTDSIDAPAPASPGFEKLTWILQAADQTKPDWRQLDVARDGQVTVTWNGYEIASRASRAEVDKISSALDAARLAEVDGSVLEKGAGPSSPAFKVEAKVGGKTLGVQGRYSEDASIVHRFERLRNAVDDVILRVAGAPQELDGTVAVSSGSVVLSPFPQTKFVAKKGALASLLAPLAGRRVRVRVVPVSLDDFSYQGGPVEVVGVYGTNEKPAGVVVTSGPASDARSLAYVGNGNSVLVKGVSGKYLEIDAESAGSTGYVAKGSLDLGLPDAEHPIARAAKHQAPPAQPDPEVEGIIRALSAWER